MNIYLSLLFSRTIHFIFKVSVMYFRSFLAVEEIKKPNIK